MQTVLERITPDMAREYLTHNSGNRALKIKTVEAYARDMKRGKFRVTHQGIAFNDTGELIDGQHRLNAIIAANLPQDMMVTRGLPKDVVGALDRGVTRSIRDTIGMRLGSSGSHTDAVLANRKVISALSQMVACNYKKMRIMTTEIEELYNVLKTPTDLIYENIIVKFFNVIIAPMSAAAIAAVYNGVNIDAVSKFFRVFFKDDITGCDGLNVYAALNWRRQTQNAKIRRTSIDGKVMYLGTQNAIYHFANNTEVNRIAIPSRPKYDMIEIIKGVICI